MNKLKKGLTYISERGSFYRYSDKDQDEKWLKPLSEYIPLEAIMRGQPVSIATPEDIDDAAKRIADAYNSKEGLAEADKVRVEAIKNALMLDSNTFIVLTNPRRHKNTIGLSYEYAKGPEYNDSKVTIPDPIHILDNGKFDIDPCYLIKSHQVENLELFKDVLNKEEYIPDFFKSSYTSLIGSQIYVKGIDTTDNSDRGQLTIVKEEAYLGYNNIIKVGFISDAWINGIKLSKINEIIAKQNNGNLTEQEEKTLEDLLNQEVIENSVSIQVQIQGDDRGALDSTLFEGIMGEPVTISSDNPIRVFAYGQEKDVPFEARINITPATLLSLDTSKAFIGLQKLDGKTELITFGDDFDINKAMNEGSVEDAAFLNVAYLQDPEFTGDDSSKNWVVHNHKAEYTNAIGTKIKNTQSSLGKAFIEAWKSLTGWDLSVTEYSNLVDVSTDGPDSTSGYIEVKSNTPGGYYYMYISDDLHGVFLQDSYTISNGSSENIGTVVLADNRIESRQNVIGVYASGNYDVEIPVGTKCVFMHDGLFKHETKKYQDIGKELFLGRCGYVTRMPDTAYNTVVKVCDIQSSEKVVVHCDNARVKTRGGDLPLGYIKPAVRIGDNYAPEYGFVLMDGKTLYNKKAYEALYTRLQAWYPKSQLDNISDEQFTAAKVDGTKSEYFIIPKCTTTTSDINTTADEHVICQIKAMEYGLYEKEPRVPYIREEGTFEVSDANKKITIDGTDYLKGICVPTIGKYTVTTYDETKKCYVEKPVDTRVDITAICDLCILEDSVQEPSLENLDIRLFVAPDYTAGGKYNWVEIRNGFQNYNNTTTYGFEWKLERYEDPSNSYPFGRYYLSTDVKEGMGIYYQTAGNRAPTDLSGKPWKIVVTRRETTAQQFDLNGVMHAYLRNRTTDEAGNPYTTKAVTGAAVIDAIENHYNIKNLLAYPDGTIDANNNKIESHILLGKETAPATEVNLSAVNEIKAYSPNGIKFETSLTSEVDTTGQNNVEDNKIVIKDNWIKVEYGKDPLGTSLDEDSLKNNADLDPNDFITKHNLTEHTSLNAATVRLNNTTDEPSGPVVHGMIFGPNGNVSASLLDDLPLGTHHTARVVQGNNGGSLKGENDSQSYIKYTYYGANPLGTETRYINNNEGIIVNNKSIITGNNDFTKTHVYSVTEYSDNADTRALSHKETIDDNYESFENITKRGNKSIVVKYNFDVDTNESSQNELGLKESNANVEFYTQQQDGTRTPASIKVGAIGVTSKAAFKTLYGEIHNNYSVTDGLDTTLGNNAQWDIFTNDDSRTEYLGSALQAAYELPLAAWQYKNEPTWYKKYLGIVIDRVNDMRDNLSTKDARTIFDRDSVFWNSETVGKESFNNTDNTFTYTDAEVKSIKTYLNSVTDNAESSQNIISTVGLLLKAAKETQDRLLQVESSTFGSDAPTIPGSHEKIVFSDMPEVTPEATHLGLNRLIRAISTELYGTANPGDGQISNSLKRSNKTQTTLSRLDEIETEIEGKVYSDETTDSANNPLSVSSGTYPYAINEETSHGGVTSTETSEADEYCIISGRDTENGKLGTYHSRIYNTTKDVTVEDTLYYQVKNDTQEGNTATSKYEEYTDGVDLSSQGSNGTGSELYIKETYTSILGNQNPIDGRLPNKDEVETAENHGTWTKVHSDKDATFELKGNNFIQDTAHNIVKENERDQFNGTVDAIARICNKVNALTYAINGKDNINSTPERLNTIRNNIETLIKEAYFDGEPETTVTDNVATTETAAVAQCYIDEDLDHTDTNRTVVHQPSVPYEKKSNNSGIKAYTGLSRFDQLSKDLYDYTISGFSTESGKNDSAYTNINFENNDKTSIDPITYTDKQVLSGRTFNGKRLLIDGTTTAEGSNIDAKISNLKETLTNENAPAAVHINVPDSIEEYQYASIIDILIDALGTGYFRHQIDRNATGNDTNTYRPTETITQRIEAIEKALDNVTHKLSQTKYFENDSKKPFEEDTPLGNETYSVENFITVLNKWLGLHTPESVQSGFYDKSVSAEVACGYSSSDNDTTEMERYFLLSSDYSEFVDVDGKLQKVGTSEKYYTYDSINKKYTVVEDENVNAEKNKKTYLYVMRKCTNQTAYLDTPTAIVNSNYVIKQLLKRLQKEESYYTAVREILGKDYNLENAYANCTTVVDSQTGLQTITGETTYTLTDDIKDLLLTIYGTDGNVSQNGTQTEYVHRSTITDSNSYITFIEWKDTSESSVYTSVKYGKGSVVWANPAFHIYGTTDGADIVGTIESFVEGSTITTKGKTYRYVGKFTNDSSVETRFTGDKTHRNIIDDIIKETYYVPNPVKFNTDETSTDTNGTTVKTYKNTTEEIVDSKRVKYDNEETENIFANTYYDFDSGKYHYDYEHNSDDVAGGATGKAIGYQNRNSLFQDYKGDEGNTYRRSRFQVLEDEIRHLRSFLGMNEILKDTEDGSEGGNTVIGNAKAAETAYGGHFYGTSDTSLAGHKFSGDATRNGNFFAKSDAATPTAGTSADSNLLTMVFNLSNALRDISRELGKETTYLGGTTFERTNGTIVNFDKFEQLNKDRDLTIYQRLANLEDLTGSLLGLQNKAYGENTEAEDEDDDADGTLNIQWIEE